MLTEEQAETISQPDENKLICALPGSGKTHTFISLVDRILDVDLTYRVLMVTFTNASAKEMEERVSNRLGKTKTKRVRAATFASLMLDQFRAIANRRKAVIGTKKPSSRIQVHVRTYTDEVIGYWRYQQSFLFPTLIDKLLSSYYSN
ncbi:UvrD-helicase domain-containing protein [Pseudoalteromonas xiamenensis]